MNRPLLWLAAGGGAAAVLVLIARKQSSNPSSPPASSPPPQAYGEAVKVTLAVPAGWRRATSAEVSELPELGVQANALMNTPGFTSMQYGTLTPFIASNGQTYATWIEQHYHAPGGAAKPWGLHHGVTVLAKTGLLADEWR